MQRARAYSAKQDASVEEGPHEITVLFKIVFGERIKFITKVAGSLEELKLWCAGIFRIIEGNKQIAISELEQCDQEIVNSLSFVYIDPQGDKLILETDEDLGNVLVFAEFAKQKLIKLIMQSSCPEVSAMH